MAPNDLKWAKNYPKWPQKKDSEFLTNSAIETQKTQKFGVNSEIQTPLEPLMEIIISKQTAIYPKDHHQNYNPKGGRNSNKTKPMVHKLGVTLEELYNGKV